MTFTPDQVRSQFSALTQTIDEFPVLFLDGPGGSQVPNSVLTAMTKYLGYSNSNLGGHFFSSQITNNVMDNARSSCAALVNAPSSNNIVFGANMTSLTFQLSRAISREWKAGDEIIVTALDHYSNVSSWQQAAEDKGVIVHQVRVNTTDCTLDMDHFYSLLSDKTKIVSVAHVSNVLGTINPVKAIIEKAKAIGAITLIDGAQAVPHFLVDVQALDCDFYVFSSHKLFGPTGIGVLYGKEERLNALPPYQGGGEMIERVTFEKTTYNELPYKFEAGTPPISEAIGLAKAIDYFGMFDRSSIELYENNLFTITFISG